MTVTDPQTDDFIAVMRRSGLFEPADLDAYLRKHGPAQSARQLAAHMLRDGVLTNFQARMLLEGKHRGFMANGKYKVLELLAVGGMGAIYLCEHTLMRRLVAMKVLSKDQGGLPSGAAERFLREARAAAQLDHPNLVRAFDLDKLGPGSNHCLIMEYVDGVSLQTFVEKNGPVAPAVAADYIAQASAGLQYAHQAGLVHRDIKPANILVSRQGVIKVLDLGLARFYGDSADNLTREHSSNAILGTADYIAPEQASSSIATVDTRADIYSLGCTLYFLLTGHPPFPTGSAAHKLIWHQTQMPESVDKIRPGVPAGLAAVVNKMIAKRPGDRYPDLRAVVDGLRPFLTGPVPLPDDKDMPPLCPAVRKLIAETNKNAPPPVTNGWASMSTQDILLPAVDATGMRSGVRTNAAGRSGIRSGGTRTDAVDLTDVPTWRGRKMTDTAVNVGGTAITPGRPPAKKLWPLVAVGVMIGAIGLVAVASMSANAPPAGPPAAKVEKGK